MLILKTLLWHPKRRYFDMKLWQEIVFLEHFFKGKWVVENVIPYYEPLITPTVEIQRHLFWSNFIIKKGLEKKNIKGFIKTENIESFEKYLGITVDWKIQVGSRDRTAQILRNCVNPDLGLYILEQARGVIRESNNKQYELF